MKSLSLALALLVLSGCVAAPKSPITDYCKVKLPLNAHTGDDTYAAPNVDWVLEFYQTAFVPYIGGQKLQGYHFDCNKYTALFAAMAQVEYSKAAFHNPTAPQALAVGEVWLLVQGRQSHSMVSIVTATGEYFFEPQTGKFIANPGIPYWRRY